MSFPSLVILAAGMGSRYGGLKQIEPIGPSGEVVLDYSVYDAIRSGFTDVVFVIRRDMETLFRERVGRRYESRINVRYVFQETNVLPAGHIAPAGREKPWGTGHALWSAATAVQQPFAVINADDFYGADSFALLGRFLSAGQSAAGCMVGFRLANTLSEHGTVSRGVCQVATDGTLADVVECTAIERQADGIVQRTTPGALRCFTGEEIVSMNCWGFTPAFFPLLAAQLELFLSRHGRDLKAEFYLPAAVAALIQAGHLQVQVLSTPANWFGVTYRQDHPQVVAALGRLIAAGDYPARLWS